MIFKLDNISGSPTHVQWFKEAYYRFWPEWFENPTGLLWSVSQSVLEHMQLRVEVWPLADHAFGWDNMGLYALLGVDLGIATKEEFCEHVIHQLLDLFIAALFERLLPVSYLTPAESEARITRACELFGQPRSAWNTGPLDRQVREAVIEVIKEHCADPALIQYRNRSSLKLQVLPIMPVGYVHPTVPPAGYETPPPRWVYSGRFIGVTAVFPHDGYDKLPLLFEGKYYDVDPGRSFIVYAPEPFPGYGELAPPEWRALLDLLALPPRYNVDLTTRTTSGDLVPERLPVSDDEYTYYGLGYYERLTWTDDQSFPSYAHDPIEAPFEWSLEWLPIGGPETGGSITSNTTYVGEYEASVTPGEILQPEIPGWSNMGYVLDFVDWPETYGVVAGHWYIGQDEVLNPAWFWREPYNVDWHRIEINVYDINGNVLAYGGGNRIEVGSHGERVTLPLTNLHVDFGGVGAFDSDRLPASRVDVTVFAGTVLNYSNDGSVLPYTHHFGVGPPDHPFYPPGFPEWPAELTEDQADLLLGDRELYEKWVRDNLLDGVAGRFQIRAYNVPMNVDKLIPDWPPWYVTLVPGNIAVGPGLSGSHPTVKGLRGGRIVGR